MRVGDELRIWIGVLITMQVVLAFGAVEMLSRMRFFISILLPISSIFA